MKNMRKHHKVIITLAACAVIAVGVAGTYSILTDATGTVVNTFTGEEINTHIYEPDFDGQTVNGNVVDKHVRVVNDGPDDAFIRVRVTVSPEENAKLVDINETDWFKVGEWYYYRYVTRNVKKNDGETDIDQSSTKFLFTGVELTKGDDVDVTVYQEAVGTGKYTVNDNKKEDGTPGIPESDIISAFSKVTTE
ncbi:MAG: hypothetical protein K6A05_07155 [Lachnospiraceae bacterium]|nr:hypothetical protein [Lachnospiraceae bacterium]